MVLTVTRRVGAWFFRALDSEGVGIFQALVYVHVLAAGTYGLLVAGATPQAVARTMGEGVETVWLWLCAGAAVCLVGKALRGSTAYLGMWLELIGDVAVGVMFATYVAATLTDSAWGSALFAVFIVSAIGECVTLLVVRDMRRIVQVERIVRR